MSLWNYMKDYKNVCRLKKTDNSLIFFFSIIIKYAPVPWSLSESLQIVAGSNCLGYTLRF